MLASFRLRVSYRGRVCLLGRIDSMIKCSPFLIAKVALKGEIVKSRNILITAS
jgi:hypothetical protein